MSTTKRQSELLNALPKMDDMGARAQTARLQTIGKIMFWVKSNESKVDSRAALWALSQVVKLELSGAFWVKAQARMSPEEILFRGVSK